MAAMVAAATAFSAILDQSLTICDTGSEPIVEPWVVQNTASVRIKLCEGWPRSWVLS